MYRYAIRPNLQTKPQRKEILVPNPICSTSRVTLIPKIWILMAGCSGCWMEFDQVKMMRGNHLLFLHNISIAIPFSTGSHSRPAWAFWTARDSPKSWPIASIAVASWRNKVKKTCHHHPLSTLGVWKVWVHWVHTRVYVLYRFLQYAWNSTCGYIYIKTVWGPIILSHSQGFRRDHKQYWTVWL